MIPLANKSDRKITITRRDDKVIVIDARSGTQNVHRFPYKEGSKGIIPTNHDTIVFSMDTLEYTIEAKTLFKRQSDILVTDQKDKEPPVRRKRANIAKTTVCSHLGEKTHEIFPPAEGLGDLASTLLSKIGITKERWATVVNSYNPREAHQLADNQGGCGGCNKRQIKLNWFGEKLGLSKGQGPELQALLNFMEVPKQSVHMCDIEAHPRCLTNLIVNEEHLKVLEESGYKLCHHCSDINPIPVEENKPNG